MVGLDGLIMVFYKTATLVSKEFKYHKGCGGRWIIESLEDSFEGIVTCTKCGLRSYQYEKDSTQKTY